MREHPIFVKISKIRFFIYFFLFPSCLFPNYCLLPLASCLKAFNFWVFTKLRCTLGCSPCNLIKYRRWVPFHFTQPTLLLLIANCYTTNDKIENSARIFIPCHSRYIIMICSGNDKKCFWFRCQFKQLFAHITRN